MEIRQQKNSNKIRFAFGEDALDYSLEDSSGSRSFSVEYTDISRDRQKLTERNAWLRNVGLFWILIGVAMTFVNWSSGKGAVPSLWLILGAGCWVAYRFRATNFTILPSDKGNIFVIDNEDAKSILREMAKRRAAKFRREYDFMPEGQTAEQHRSRFRWLHSEGALSEEELQTRLAAIPSEPLVIERAANLQADTFH